MRLLIALLAFLSSPSYAATICPPGMGLVPATSPWSGQDYCIQKKEAVRFSIAGSWQWNYITQSNAVSQCQNLYPQGDLPVNALWQALLYRAEDIADNWTGGTVGSGALKTDLKLPDGLGDYSVFEDIGDGHWEFVIGAGPTGSQVTSGHVYQLSTSNSFTVNGLTGSAKFHFGPEGTYGAGAELGVTTNTNSGYIMRGGDDEEPGAFGVALNHQGQATSDVSFRCTCPKSACGVE
jgi:hypothetical protein